MALLVIPISAWADGRLIALGRWHADDRAESFRTVILHSPHQFSAQWVTEGSHFKSPPLLLLAKLNDTFVVLEDQSRKDIVVVIPDSEVLRADYVADEDPSMDSGQSR